MEHDYKQQFLDLRKKLLTENNLDFSVVTLGGYSKKEVVEYIQNMVTEWDKLENNYKKQIVDLLNQQQLLVIERNQLMSMVAKLKEKEIWNQKKKEYIKKDYNIDEQQADITSDDEATSMKFERMHEQLSNKDRQLSDVINENNMLKKEISALQKAEENEDDKKQITNLNFKIAQLEQAIADERSKFEEQAMQAQTRIQELTQNHDANDKQVLAFTTKLKEYEQVIRLLQAEKMKISEAYSQREKEMNQLLIQLKEQKDKCLTFENMYASIQLQNEQLNEKIDSLEEVILNKTQEMQMMLLKKQELEESIRILVSTIESVQKG